LKPSFGLIPVRGHIPPPPGVLSEIDVGVLGPLARDAVDLDLLLGVLAGPDAGAAVAWRLALPPPRATALREFRVAAWLDDPYCPIDRELLRLLEGLVDTLRGEHVTVVDGAPAVDLADAHEVAQRLIQGSMSLAVPDEEYERLRQRAAGSDPGDRSPPVLWARHITQTARDLNLVIERREHHAAAWAGFFQDHDVLLCPVMLTAAFPHTGGDPDERTVEVDGRPRPYADQFAWLQSIGVVHLPAVVAPIGLTAAGLPVGVQIVAPHLEDRTAIEFARLLAEVIGGYQPPPGY
jgi:amidase